MTLGPIDYLSSYDHETIERECRELWEQHRIHHFDPDGPGEIFAVDTPPPYVSAAHLHVGHAMSYTQAEFVVRWHRMKGRRPFYPMGFDDNGLPTERYVERAHGIDKSSTTRSAFRALCLEETTKGAAAYEELWRALGLSVDWRLRYSTIDPHCRRTAQLSFLELLRSGRIYRSEEPVLWDPAMQTALAQADLETRTRRRKLHLLRFGDLCIATTRPELLPACVALYHHPDDERYSGRSEAVLPLFGRRVPMQPDPDVDPAFGTGLMMVCTFGDAEDVRRWKRDGLDTRVCIGPDGCMTAAAGPYAGLQTDRARKRILADLQAAGAHGGFEMTEQVYPVAERSGAPVEFMMAPQWFVRVLDRKQALLERSDALNWHPQWMKARLDHWIEGLRWDWNISRQRFYGVPFPVWLCADCGRPVLADAATLPIDPLEDAPPCDACPECGGALRGDPDVMDTWMTSSMTPQIHSNWAGSPDRMSTETPLSVRVQAFEIIRTWLFYTLLKADLHGGELPWRDVMISGWGLNEQGRKISKRDLEKSTDASGFNRYEPAAVMAKWGADALRHWAGRSQLGHDLRYNAKDVRAGRKVVVKLWNAGRLAAMQLEEFDPGAPRPPLAVRPPEDRDLLHGLDLLIRTVDDGLASYDYATGLQALDHFFFSTFCDDWLETIKSRSDAAACATLWEGMRTVLGLYAPYLPFVTEAVWRRLYGPFEDTVSLHKTSFPTPIGAPPAPEMSVVRTILRGVRAARTEARLPQSREVALLTIDPAHHDLEPLLPTLKAACRAREICFGAAEQPLDNGLAITLSFAGAPG